MSNIDVSISIENFKELGFSEQELNNNDNFQKSYCDCPMVEKVVHNGPPGLNISSARYLEFHYEQNHTNECKNSKKCQCGWHYSKEYPHGRYGNWSRLSGHFFLHIDCSEDCKECNSCKEGSKNSKDPPLKVDYIYLSYDERRRYAQQGREYLIEQLEQLDEKNT